MEVLLCERVNDLRHRLFHLWAEGITKSHREQGLDYREGEELTWCPSWSNSLWQRWSCGLVHCPSGNATDQIRRVLVSSNGISPWTPLKPQHSITCWLFVQWEPSACRSCFFCLKRDHQKFVGGFALSGLLGSGRASMLPLGTLSLGLWVIAVDPAFTVGHQSVKNYGIWIDQLDHLPAVMTTSFFLIFSEHPWDKRRTNLPHLQFLANNYVYSSHTDIKLCTYCLYRHTTVLIHGILYLANQCWCSDFLIPPTPLIIPQITQKLMPDSCKMLQKQCEAFHTEFYCILFF